MLNMEWGEEDRHFICYAPATTYDYFIDCLHKTIIDSNVSERKRETMNSEKKNESVFSYSMIMHIYLQTKSEE